MNKQTNTAFNGESVFSYGDYLTWPENERWEIIDGLPTNMSPSPNTAHQEISVELMFQIRSFFYEKTCRVFAAPFDVRFPEEDEVDDAVRTVVQPDISIICDPNKLDKQGCRGAPDVIMEILSPSTASRDKILKFNLYEKHGVKEYWLIHPTDRTVTVFYLDQARRFGRPDTYSTADIVPSKALKGLTIDLTSVFTA